MGEFTVPNKHQQELMERNGIAAKSVSVILENDSHLILRNHITGDDVSISKGERTRRLEQSGNQ